jgi:class 3 adenylate cyclase
MGEERRLVTILFADVIESTELGESLDPEDVRGILGAYYELAREAIAKYGGTVEKFIGDAVMAVFGLPAAHGDDPQRALAAALEIRSRINADQRLTDHLRVRFGVNTGDVVAAVDASGGDFLVTGDAVNVAARLQQAARPWAILCGERTVHAADTTFKFGPRVLVPAKGKSADVPAAQLIGRHTGPLQQTPFVGREADLAELELLGRRALLDKRPGFVSIIAPAGTGKTRLLDELLGRLRREVLGVRVIGGQCLPYGERLTYWPLRATLLGLIGAPFTSSAQEIRSALWSWLGDDDPLHERTGEVLASTIGAGGLATDRVGLQSAWRYAIETGARRGPLVVVIEDLHWASDSLLDLIDMLEPRDDVPLLLIALMRPELLDRRPGWGGGRRSYAAITLDPLAPPDIEQIVRTLLPQSSALAVERVVARADGNPFYAVELVRMLGDRAAQPDQIDHAFATLPDTVQAAVLERLDLLGREERRVMQLGSVLGRSFRSAGVVALADDLAPHVDAALELLLAKDLVRQANADTFAFRHILIHEVAYQTLARAERSRLHAAAAAWLERTANGNEDALAELIAYHYREAAVLSRTAMSKEPPAAIRAKAVAWLERAADNALNGAAHVEAVRHLRAAAELADRDRLADLYERIGDAFVSGDAVEAYRQALAAARDGDRSADRQLRAIAGMLHVSLRSGGLAGGGLSGREVEALREEGARLMNVDVSDASIARFLVAESFEPFAIARIGLRSPTEEQLSDAEGRARRALRLADQLKDLKLRSAALDGLGSIMSLRGDHHGAREMAYERIELGDALDLVERLDAYAVAAWLSVWLGELDRAIDTSGAALGLVQPGQATSWALHVMSWRALALMLRGRWDDALEAGERAYALWVEGGKFTATFALQGFVAALSIAHARRDDKTFDRFRGPIVEIGARSPRPLQRRLEFLSRDDREPDHYIQALDQRQPDALTLALGLACDAGRPPALRLLRRIASSERVGALPLLLGEVKRAEGLAGRDRKALIDAAGIFDRCGALPSAARARCESALLRGSEAELSEGISVLEVLGDVRQIERYRKLSRV